MSWTSSNTAISFPSCVCVIGGIVSILSLHGLFTLMVEHNLEYPDFYARLYALIDEKVFQSKYRSEFLKLVWLFLKSP